MAAYLAEPIPAKHKPLKRGLYYDQFGTWLGRFPRGQLLVLTSDVLYKEPAMATDQVLDFLGVRPKPEGWAGFNFKAAKNAVGVRAAPARSACSACRSGEERVSRTGRGSRAWQLIVSFFCPPPLNPPLGAGLQAGHGAVCRRRRARHAPGVLPDPELAAAWAPRHVVSLAGVRRR